MNRKKLAKLVPLYLCIPASSAPVESLFSIAGKVFSIAGKVFIIAGKVFSIAGKVFQPDRCRLKDKTFEELMSDPINIYKC